MKEEKFIIGIYDVDTGQELLVTSSDKLSIGPSAGEIIVAKEVGEETDEDLSVLRAGSIITLMHKPYKVNRVELELGLKAGVIVYKTNIWCFPYTFRAAPGNS